MLKTPENFRKLFVRSVATIALLASIASTSLALMGNLEDGGGSNGNTSNTSKTYDNCKIADPGETAIGIAGNANTEITINKVYIYNDRTEVGAQTYSGPAVNAHGLEYTTGLFNTSGEGYTAASKVCK